MYRVSTTYRGSDEFSVNLSLDAIASAPRTNSSSTDLPIYDPISDSTKKDVGLHHRSLGENSVHLIPLVLFLCALILWVFSRSVGKS
ncbi:hypothetical protein MANES_11G101800v8 [Manihot esculenta]|uniref:Uncharacterized protein n=1 Tax=Manihot esculenta TaxID=3983 RepID=A0A2C9UZT8_MANES|nr:hypothetical protein MANES_11G101800v8 [Manihot esculenta]